LGELRTIIGQRGRSVAPPDRASRWICLIWATAWSSVAAMSKCIFSGSSPSTK
jgi:hypothetical protein